LLSIAIIVGIVVLYRVYYNRRVERFGYSSRADYFRAAPRTDDEKREAVDQALKGLVICLVGLMFPPLLLVGVVPLFIGGRKTLFASMGLGLSDEIDPTGA
jgi:hypothetical protein